MALKSRHRPDYGMLKEKLQLIHELRGIPPRAADEGELANLLDRLLEGYPCLEVPLPDKYSGGWVKARLRKGPDDYLKATQEMSYRKDGSPVRARASEPGEEILYAARNDGTALSENDAQTGDWYQLSRFVLRDSKSAHAIVIGEIEYTHQSGGLSLLGKFAAEIPCLSKGSALTLEQTCAAIVVDAFIAEMFARSNSGQFDYKMTTGLVRALLAGGKAGAVLYPSIKHRGGLNVAIQGTVVDECFEMIEGEYGEVERFLGYGMHILHQTHRVLVNGDALSAEPQDSWRVATA